MVFRETEMSPLERHCTGGGAGSSSSPWTGPDCADVAPPRAGRVNDVRVLVEADPHELDMREEPPRGTGAGIMQPGAPPSPMGCRVPGHGPGGLGRRGLEPPQVTSDRNGEAAMGGGGMVCGLEGPVGRPQDTVARNGCGLAVRSAIRCGLDQSPHAVEGASMGPNASPVMSATRRWG
jgi:hypothetical protein